MVNGFVTIDANNKLPAVVTAELDTTYATKTALAGKVRVDTTVGERVFVTDAAGVEHMVSGDTGLRIIPDTDLINGWTSESSTAFWLRREGTRVTLTAASRSVDGSAATADSMWAIPAGFRIAVSGNYAHIGYFGETLVQKSFNNFATKQRSTISGVISWPTNEAWPTTLPGSPA